MKISYFDNKSKYSLNHCLNVVHFLKISTKVKNLESFAITLQIRLFFLEQFVIK